VADEFVRAGQLDQAVRIYQKTLEMDPENIAMRTKLAEVYLRLDKKTEAWQILTAAVEAMRSKGQLASAEEILQRMLKLDPGSSYALRLRGNTAFEAGDSQAAINYLEKVADLDSNPDGLRTLMQAYMRTGRLPEAGTLAEKLFSVHNDPTAILSFGDALIAAGQFNQVLALYDRHSEGLLAANSRKVLDTLHPMIGYVRENAPALEILLGLLQKAGDPTHITEVYELLAHAWVQAGSLDKARDCYLKLTQLEPDNLLHARNYQQVLSRLRSSSGSRRITAEEGAVLVDELEATAPFVDQRYPDDVAAAIRGALTDAELFISYNLPDKALRPLVAALRFAPHEVRLNQKLAALHTRAGRFTEAAVCCRTLEGVFREAGYPDEAGRYANLASQYEECAADASSPTPAPPAGGTLAPAPMQSAQPEFAISPEIDGTSTGEIWAPQAPLAGPASHEAPAPFSVAPGSSQPRPIDGHTQEAAEQEIDLSGEWESEFSDESELAPAAQAEDARRAAVEAKPAASKEEAMQAAMAEIRSYLADGMTESAQTAYHTLRDLGPDPATLAAMHREIEAAITRSTASNQAVPVEESEAETEILSDVHQPAETEDEAEEVVTAETDNLDALVKDLESSVGDDFLPKTTSHEIAQEEEVPVHAAARQRSAATVQSVGSLNQFVSDLENSLGADFLAAAPVAGRVPQVEASEVEQPIPVAASAPAARAAAAAAAQAGTVVEPTSAGLSFTVQPRPHPPASHPGPGPIADPGPRVDLAGMFGELRQTLEESSTEVEEDPETHYNLGVAFREMGLLDEAIAELQKVCKAAEHDQRLPHIMQTYTWLAQCFLDKGVPEAAIRWYDKALQLPSLDQETRTALHYELGSSYEAAGNKSDALNHFLEVYGRNIDYRDVAERVKSLKS
jgi:tetratricopeptide (TPR) repeat protein